MSRRLQWIGWGTLLGFPLLGALVLWIFQKPVLATMLRSELNPVLQIGLGGAIGTLLGLGARYIVSLPILLPIAEKYSGLVYRMKLKSRDVYFLSFCAGFGEELFFRGAFQPLVGLWPAAIIFVAIHGYLNPMNWRVSIYGIYMTLAIALLGYLTEWWGIWTACAAHMVIDIILFQFLIKLGHRQARSFEYPAAEVDSHSGVATNSETHEAP